MTVPDSAKPVFSLHHVTIRTRNLEDSLHLYRDLLGMPLVTEFEVPGKKICLLATGNGSHIELFSEDQPTTPATPVSGDHPLVHLALETHDIHAGIEKVRQAGYQVILEPKVADLKKFQAIIAFFIGPGGEEIELFQVVSPPGSGATGPGS